MTMVASAPLALEGHCAFDAERRQVKTAILLCATAFLCCSCATNRAVFSESITAPDGTVTTTSLELTARATAGSKLQEGSGSVAYAFGDSLLEVGNDARGLDSESAAKLIQAILTGVPLVAPLLAPAVPEQGEVP